MWSKGAIGVPTEDGKYLAVKYYVKHSKIMGLTVAGFQN